MIMDKMLVLCDSQAQTTADTYYSDSTVDLTKAGDSLDNLWLTITTPVACTGTTGGLVTFTLETSATSNFASATPLLVTGAIPTATMVKGYKILQGRIPMGVLQYLRLKIVIATQALTTGAWDAYLTSGIDKE